MKALTTDENGPGRGAFSVKSSAPELCYPMRVRVKACIDPLMAGWIGTACGMPALLARLVKPQQSRASVIDARRYQGGDLFSDLPGAGDVDWLGA